MMDSKKFAPFLAACAITAAGVFLTASPSAAKERPVVVEAPADEEATVQRVGYGDLNLASATGKKQLYRRVGRAVGKVCATANPGAHFTDVLMCRDMSWDDARPQILRAIERADGTAVADASGNRSASIVIRVR